MGDIYTVVVIVAVFAIAPAICATVILLSYISDCIDKCYPDDSDDESDSDVPNIAAYQTSYVINIPEDVQNICSICLDNFCQGDVTRVLDCGHYYHAVCVDEWLDKGKKCPKCDGNNVVKSGDMHFSFGV